MKAIVASGANHASARAAHSPRTSFFFSLTTFLFFYILVLPQLLNHGIQAQELIVEDVLSGQVGKDVPVKIGASTSSAIPLGGNDFEFWFQSNQDYLRTANVRVENGQLSLLTPEGPLWSDGAGLPADAMGQFCNGQVLAPENDHAHWAGPSILQAMGEKVLISAYGNSDVIRGSISLSYTDNGQWKHQHLEPGPDFLLYPICFESSGAPNTWVQPADPTTYNRGIGEICKHNGVAFTAAIEFNGYYYVYFNVTTNHGSTPARTIQLMRVPIDSNPPYVKFGPGEAELYHKGQGVWHDLPYDPDFGYFLNICGQPACSNNAGGASSVWCQNPLTFNTVQSWSVTGLNDLGRLGGITRAQDGQFLLSHVDHTPPDSNLDIVTQRRTSGRVAYWRSAHPTFHDTSIQYINTDLWLEDPVVPEGCPNDNSTDTWYVNMSQAQSWLHDLPGDDPDMILFTSYHDARCQAFTRGKIRASLVSPRGAKLCVTQQGASLNDGDIWDFGTAPPETNIVKRITLENCGNDDLVISDAVVGGTHRGNFRLRPWFRNRLIPMTLQPDATYTLPVIFRGIAPGPRQARLTFATNAPANPDFVLNLRGEIETANFPEVCLRIDGQQVSSGATWDFGSTPSNVAVSETAMIENCGTDTLTVQSAVISGTNQFNFYFPSSFTVPLSLAPGAQAPMPVTMSGSQEGTRSALLTLSSNAAQDFLLNLSGQVANPTTPEICVLINGQQMASGGTWNFGSTPSGVPVGRTATLRNCGTAPLNVSNAAITGTHRFNFYFSSSFNVPLTLAPGAQTAMTVSMSGSQEGSRSALLTLSSNAAGSPSFQLNLAGQIANPTSPELCILLNGQPVSPGSVWDFGSTPSGVPVGQTAVLQNCGTATLSLSGAGITGTHRFNFYFPASFSLPSTLAPGGQAAMPISMTGSATGPRSAVVTVTSNASGSPSFSLSLTGQITN